MATKQRKTVAGEPAVTHRARIITDLPEQEAEHLETEAAEIVTAKVPKAFNLTLDSGHTVRIEAGVRPMPREHAEHYYAKAHGVTIES